MKRLKTILQFNILFIILALLITIYVIFITIIKEYQSSYNNPNIITGKIIDYSFKDNQLSLFIKANEKFKATYYFSNEEEQDYIKKSICLGCTIVLNGTQERIKKNTIPNTFNYQQYLYNKKIYFNYKVKLIKISHDNNLLYEIKDYFYKKTDEQVNSAYLKMFILGDKRQLDSNTYDIYRKNGIAHLFAISGMHIALLIKALDLLLKRLNAIKKTVLISTILFVYSFITSFASSINRAILFYILLNIKKIFSLRISNFKLLLICAIILIILNPFIVYDIGFQYSFIITGGIIINNKYIKGNYFQKLIVLSIICFIFSLPITINLNYEINLLSIIYNLLFVPLVSLFLYPFTLICFILPFLNPILSFFITVFEEFNKTLSINSLIIPKMSIFLIIIYYLILLLNIKKIKKIICIFLIVIINISIPKLDNNYYITFLDVGQGDSIFITTPHKKETILIDTGGITSFNSKNTYNISNNYIKYFKSIGVNKINYLVITHGDYDHMGEAINLVENFKIGKVIFNCGEFNELEKGLIKVLDKKKISYYSCIKELNIDNNKLYFLQTKEYDNENDNSNVIYTKINGYKFMFMGDAGIEKEKDILDKYNISDIDVLKVGHHGSKTSSSESFINETNPKYSIISVGKNNRYGHPNKEILNTLNNSKIYRTDQDGSIMFKIKNNKLKIETCSP